MNARPLRSVHEPRSAKVAPYLAPSRCALVLAALLAACASLPAEKQPLPGETGSRLALRVDATGEEQPRSVVAGFELQGVAEAGRSTFHAHRQPMAQARWQPGRVVLVTPQGETPHAKT